MAYCMQMTPSDWPPGWLFVCIFDGFACHIWIYLHPFERSQRRTSSPKQNKLAKAEQACQSRTSLPKQNKLAKVVPFI